ncbi:MAG: 16S rRNA (guanine(966)-N(2))-methyltransferase RsmD [Clostridiales bacterium]|nr:16S rRNA (guanine(966)-N(2))-methyltransferase RsmD [Clostridiales bacterium]
MRIIAGSAKGHTIASPKGRHTRPTQDYVRESLFNIIQRYVPGAKVLDLFAGSGALGLEALSRGADRAMLADNAVKAIDCIRRNAETLGFGKQSTVIRGDWRGVLQSLEKQSFDLVFLDPPYDLTQYRDMTDTLIENELLSDDALIVIEHRKDVIPGLSPPFILKDHRTYGDTVIHIYRFNAGGKQDGE